MFRMVSKSMVLMAAVALSFTISNNSYANSSDSDDVVKQWNQLVASISEYTAKKRQQTAAFFQKQLDALDGDIDYYQQRMERETEELSDDVNDRRQHLIASLKESKQRLSHWMKKADSATEKSWETINNGVERSLDELSDTMKKLEQEFSDGN